MNRGTEVSQAIADDVKLGPAFSSRGSSICIVGAGAVVTRDIPPRAIVAGNPARWSACSIADDVEWTEQSRGPGASVTSQTPITAVGPLDGPPRDRGRRCLSIIALVYNEHGNLKGFYERLSRVLARLPYDAEVVCVDDGSTDGSFEILQGLHRHDARIKVVRLSRNFGSWNAVAAGLDAASGDMVMWISSDLQDPPELIPDLIRQWATGAHVVWAVRSERHDPWPRRFLAVLFYRLLRRIALPEYPPLGMDICLLDRRVVDILKGLRERNRFTQGLILRLGFTQTRVSYIRERRQRGESKWGNFARLSKIGVDMIAGFSNFPFRFMGYIGGIAVLAGFALAIVLVLRRVVAGAPMGLDAWMMPVLFFFGGLNAIMVGVLGEYVWRVLDEVRQRPLYVIQERVGFASDVPNSTGAGASAERSDPGARA